MPTKDKPTFVKSKGTAYFARLDYKKPDLGFDGKSPNIQICLVPDEPKEFTDHKIKLKEPTDNIPGPWVKIKTRWLEKPLNVKDAKNNRLPHDFIIGNESIVNVLWSPYEYTGGVSPTLRGVQVLEHVPYESKDPFEEEEGFEAEVTSGDMDDEIPF